MEHVTRNFPAVLFTAMFVKVLLMGGSFVDVSFLGISGLLFVALEFKLRKNQLAAIEAKIVELDSRLVDTTKESKELKTYLNSVKISQSRNTTNGRF